MSRKVVPEMAFDNSSSDDDSPEEISVAASREESISQMKHIQDSLRRSKEEERERRRQRNEMFRIQKEIKVSELSKRKLSDDVLAAVSAKWAKKSQATKGKGESDPETNDDIHDDDRIDKQADSGDDMSDSGVEDVTDGQSSAEEFIPFSKKSGLSLITPGALAKKVLTSAQRAQNFKQNRLYNQSAIPRENTEQRRARAEKRYALSKK